MLLGPLELGLILIGLLTAFYYYLVSTYDYWKSRGVKGPKPMLFLGTTKDILLLKSLTGDYLGKVYKEWRNEPFSGIFVRREPVLVLHDLDLIKDVLIKDFSNFSDRGTRFHEKVDPITAHLFNLEPKRWRPLRLKLSPVFTSGKLKEMFHMLVESVGHLDKNLGDKIDATNTREIVMDVRDLTGKFTTDVIGICGFGLQLNTMEKDESLFWVMGRRLFSTSLRRRLQIHLRTLAPAVYDVVGHALTDRKLNSFFLNMMRQMIDCRKKSGVVKHDFVDILMGIKDNPEKMADIDLTDNLLAAQLFVFFIAGSETSSATMSNAFYELALNPKIQEKLREEIKDEMDTTGGSFDYERIKSMRYLDMVFNETLRKYPLVTFLTRKSKLPYTFHNSSKDKLLTIDGEVTVWIPTWAIQMDPQYFPEPEVFDPERFTDEAIKSRHPMAYLPFGDGPRNCVGKRFGVMQTKVGLVKILHHYSFEVCEKTPLSYEIDPTKFLLTPKNGIYLKIVRDEKK